MRRLLRRPAPAIAAVLATAASATLTGCTPLELAAPAPGKRPGVDVPSDPVEAAARPIGAAHAVFNTPALAARMPLGQAGDAQAVLLHELAHVVGLDHVTDPYQVMYDTNAYPPPSYRAGDRRGPAELGLGRCYDDY